jgi:uncharacterized membrane protein YbhN (UPF0104 family)
VSPRQLAIAARVVVSAGLLALVGLRLDGREALAACARVQPATLLLCTALALAGYWGRALRWSALLRQGGVAVSNPDAYRLTLIGIFYGLVTPGRVGELGRALHLDLPRERTLPSVVWDRFADVLLLELLSTPAFLVHGIRSGPLLWAYLAVVGMTVLAMLALDSPRLLEALGRRFPRHSGWLSGWSGGATGMLRSRAFARGLAAGLFFYALNFAGAWLLLGRLAPGYPPRLALMFPVIILLGNLPVAFGGLGLREQVSAVAFARLGASATVGPVFSLLWFLVVTVIPALIGLALAHTRWGRASGALLGASPGAAAAGGPIER